MIPPLPAYEKPIAKTRCDTVKSAQKIMNKSAKIRLQITALLCSIAAVLASAVPLFNRQNDAQVLLLFCGAFGAGITLSNIIHDKRRNRE
jgi:hypothetical protein